MTKDKGPSPEVLQKIVDTLFLVLMFPILYYAEEIFDLLWALL